MLFHSGGDYLCLGHLLSDNHDEYSLQKKQ
jgi:hypothetical protein